MQFSGLHLFLILRWTNPENWDNILGLVNIKEL